MADISISIALQGVLAVQAELQKTAKVAESMGKSMQNVGQSITNVGKGLTTYLTAPLVAAAAGLTKVANDFEGAKNSLHNATGAVGKDLQQLEQISRSVFRQVPSDLGKIADVVGELNTRTGETGPRLQQLSRQVVELGRLTKSEATSIATGYSQTIKQLGIETSKTGETLDQFFLISQRQGIQITSLIGTVNEYGSVLQSAGLNALESADLIARMNSAGLNFSRISPGINAALRNFAARGLELGPALEAAIVRIREATTRTEKLKIATEVFGAEGAQRIVQAIERGVLPSLEGLGKGLDNARGLIAQTGAQSRTFGEELTVMKNDLLEAIEPLGKDLIAVFRAAKPAIIEMIDNIRGMVHQFQALPLSVQLGVGKIIALIGLGGPMLIAIGGVTKAVGTMTLAFGGLVKTLALLLPYLLPLAGIIAGIVATAIGLASVAKLIYDNWSSLSTFFRDVSKVMAAFGQSAKDTILFVKDWFVDKFKDIIDWFAEKWKAVMDLIPDSVLRAMGVVRSSIASGVDLVVDKTGSLVNTVTDNFKDLKDNTIQFYTELGDQTQGIVSGWIDKMGLNFSVDLPAAIVPPTETATEQVVDSFNDMQDEVTDSSKETVNSVRSWFSQLDGVMVQPVKDSVADVLEAFGGMKSTTADILSATFQLFSDFVTGTGGALNRFAGSVIGALQGAGGKTGAATNLITSVLGSTGAGSVLSSVGGALGIGGGAAAATGLGGGLGGVGGGLTSGGFLAGTPGAVGEGTVLAPSGGGLFSGIGNIAKTAGAGLAGGAIGNFLGQQLFGRSGSGIGTTIGGIAGSFFGPLGSFLGSTLGGLIDTFTGNAPDIPGFTIDINNGTRSREIVANNELLKAFASPFGVVDFRTRNKPLQGPDWMQQGYDLAGILTGINVAEINLASMMSSSQIMQARNAVASMSRTVVEGNLNIAPWFSERFKRILSVVPQGDLERVLSPLDLALGTSDAAQAVAALIGGGLSGGASSMAGIGDNVPMFQTGTSSVFTRPTLIGVGENGPELVNVSPLGGRTARGGLTLQLNGPAIFDSIGMNRFTREIDRALSNRDARFG